LEELLGEKTGTGSRARSGEDWPPKKDRKEEKRRRRVGRKQRTSAGPAERIRSKGGVARGKSLFHEWKNGGGREMPYGPRIKKKRFKLLK